MKKACLSVCLSDYLGRRTNGIDLKRPRLKLTQAGKLQGENGLARSRVSDRFVQQLAATKESQLTLLT